MLLKTVNKLRSLYERKTVNFSDLRNKDEKLKYKLKTVIKGS